MKYLSAADVVELHRMIVHQSGGAGGVRDIAALESSVAKPHQTFADQALYESLITKAAATAFFLIRNHPFVDGNKRVGHAALEVTLTMNGLELRGPVADQETIILALAAGSLTREDFTSWVNGHIDRLGDQTVQETLERVRDFPLIRARMTLRRAALIRKWRVDEGYSWRTVAAECYEHWADDACWDPPSNQLAGMELCETAAELVGEHFLAPPWN